MKGWAGLFDGPLDLAEKAREAAKRFPSTALVKYVSINWPGRRGNNWDDVNRFLHSPWPEATQLIKRVVDGVMSEDLPQPKNIKRKPRWNEDDGDVDVDRLLTGEPEYMKQTKRGRSTGPFHVALVSNLDAGKGHQCNSSGVWFRSAACIALADILENLGYTVEIWTWTAGFDVYPDPYHNQFLACRPKAAGDPVDIDSLCDTMSSWFTTTATFGAFNTAPVQPESRGGLIEASFKSLDPKESGIKGWYKYLDIGADVIPIAVPMIKGWGLADGLDKASEVVKNILEHICKDQ